MNTALKLDQQPVTLRSIKGYQSQQQVMTSLLSTLWTAAHTAFWNSQVFSSEEKQKSLAHLRYYLLGANDLQQGYMEIIQRLLLTRYNVYMQSTSPFPTPSEYLDPDNDKGFVVSENWFAQLQKRRQSLPLYKLALKAFAEAIQEMAEEPTAQNFHYWRSYFIEHHCPGLLNLFLATVANLNNRVE